MCSGVNINAFPDHCRKVADVKREQELAERRKNEPQLAQNQDHLVRKIFSKFRRVPHPQGSKDIPGKESTTHSDVEKGDSTSVDHDRGKLPAKLTLTEDMRSLSAAPSPSPSPSPSSGPPSARGKPSKWGRLLGSSSVDSASDTSTKVAVSRSLSARESLRESVAQGRQNSVSGGGGGPGNKVFPKTTKLAPSPATSLARQDTIDEGGEGESLSPIPVPQPREHRLSIDRTGSGERGSADRSLSLERERQIEMACSRATMIDTYDTGLREQPSTLAERDLVATVMDMKVDMRLEMQRMNQRISKIEDMLGDLVKRLSTDVNTSSVSTPGTVAPHPQIEELSSTFALTVVGPQAIPSVSTTPVMIESPVTESAPGSLGTSTTGSTSGSTSGGGAGGGNGLAPMMMKKRRSKSRKAPPPPPGRSLPEEERLLDPGDAQQSGSGSRKREFL